MNKDYSEKQRKWKYGLHVLEIKGKQIWVNTVNQFFKQNISRKLPVFEDENERVIMKLLKSLSTLSKEDSPCILLTDYIVGNDPIQYCAEFKKAKR